jgi:hypothetical protein
LGCLQSNSGRQNVQDRSLKAVVLSVVPADNITVPIHPPPGPSYTANTTSELTITHDATTANATLTTDPAAANATTINPSVADKLLSTTWEDAPSKPTSLTWQDAPACLAAPDANNTSKDDLGRLWGWEADASCAFKDAAGLPHFTFELAPVCVSVVGTSRNAEGRLWGWENGMSCKILHIVSP